MIEIKKLNGKVKNNDWDPKGSKEFIFVYQGEKQTFIGIESTLLRDYPGCLILKTYKT